jgi:two-component system, cell cycle sensor histidine kinase and response regulator CckA
MDGPVRPRPPRMDVDVPSDPREPDTSGRAAVASPGPPLAGGPGSQNGPSWEPPSDSCAREALDAFTARLHKLAAELPGFIYQYQLHSDGSCSFPYASQGIEAIYGAGPHEVMHDARKVFDVLHANDLPRIHQSILDSAATLTGWHESYRVNHPDGRSLWVEGSATPERLADGSTLWHGYIQDITERKRAQVAVRLREAALEAAATAVMIADRDGIIQWANPAFSELTGYSLAESLGRTPWELVRSGANDDALYQELRDTLSAGKPWEGELVNRRKDGTCYPEAMSINPVRDPEGEITHFVAFKRNLTEERTRQAQLLQAQKMESVGRLAGGIAHDFNNLLTVITGTVELALASLAQHEPLHADLTDVREAAQRASALTRQLLAFSRQQVLRPEVMDLNRVVSDLSKMLRRLIGEELAFALDLAEDLGVVKADVNQLEQVILNLVVNARDAMPDGGTLTVTTRSVTIAGEGPDGPTPGEYVRLTVQDTGVGIAPSVKARLFEPFFTTKEVGKGTGLGLATAFGIVSQSGGTITVDSVEGRGAAFHVFLPRLGGEEVPAAGPGARDGAEEPPTARGTILLVDDEPTLRRITLRILERAGYRVLAASSGAEAIRLAERHPGTIDLLLTDIVMPGMNGPQLFAELRRRDPELRVLFTSGYPGDAGQDHRLPDGGDVPFIPKPYSVADLTAQVRRLLTARERSDAPI